MKTITVLAVPKPFHGHIGVIQRNAITSWTNLKPRPEVILFGQEEGTARCAADLGLVHVPDVARNRNGTPLLSDIFATAERQGCYDVFAYVNADIILPTEFMSAVEIVRRAFPSFLAVGRRSNLNVREPLDFNTAWEARLKQRVQSEGWLDNHTSIDCFVFPRGTYKQVPPLAIGRVWFDQWCIKYALTNGLPVIDLTKYMLAIHQIHDYSHVAGGKQWVYGGPEADENLFYYGEQPHTYTILSATHLLTRQGRIRRVFLRKEIHTVRNVLWNVFINRTHSLRKRLGLTRGARA